MIDDPHMSAFELQLLNVLIVDQMSDCVIVSTMSFYSC